MPPFKQLSTWQETVAQLQDHLASSIAPFLPSKPLPSPLPLNVTALPSQYLSESDFTLTSLAPETLIARLASGSLTSAAVTTAFLRRAALASKLTNCITELLPSALTRSAELDAYYKQHGKPIGPLHGLPISVKEHLGLEGLDNNAGYVSWIGNVAPRDALIVDLLKQAGAVIYARTTQPQTLMHLETSSNIYGETVNPYNRKLTAGGSSGGEGALVGMRGSVLGIGTDIGGSIRSPAANCGVYGLRPTSYRLPNEGGIATMLGQEHVVPVIGPLSTSLEGIRIFAKTLVDRKPWLRQPCLLPFPWKEENQLPLGTDGKPRLKVAVLWDDEVVKPHPPILRALREVVGKLKDAPDVEVVTWKPYKHFQAWEIIASLYFADGGKETSAAIEASSEPWRPLSSWIVRENPYAKALSVSEVWDWTMRREAYKAEYAALWNATATGTDENGVPIGMVDVILCPVGPGTAPPLDCARYWGYTAQWNVLDYPALVFPVTQVDPAIDVKEEEYTPRSNGMDEYNYKLYEPETYRDAPVSLQLVGRRYEDEKVIQALEFLKKYITLPL
ncbi:amidase [Trichodelitschia bisporula]|uniref:amidase n=1 Tax=Trichodelitschia bisporula TaxID=703511 RepID=A0A6G1I3Y7_9PEZI|nr:amidase [Trichodelitschia bisporula]